MKQDTRDLLKDLLLITTIIILFITITYLARTYGWILGATPQP